MSKTSNSKLFEFFRVAEKLKTELRHSWTSNPSRQESVAEHIWMVVLMSFVLSEKVGKRIDQLKVMKMAVIHDLAEALTGDIPSHELSARQDTKQLNEYGAIKKLSLMLDKKLGREFTSLWKEFEERKTFEAKFVYAIDKFECLFEHDCTDIKTWDGADYRYTFIDKQDTPFDFDKFLRSLKDKLDDWTFNKVEEEGTIKLIPEENVKRYRDRKSTNQANRKG